MGVYEDFDEQKQFACRVIADHARTTAFAIADGILPGNEGRNYVLRKIMRRAIYHGREHLGFQSLFFHKVCNFVVGEMKVAFPELEVQREFIGKMVRLEEERFGNTLTVGLKKLNEILSELDSSNIETDLPPLINELAKLYDTYGVPKDLIHLKFAEKTNAAVPEEIFDKAFDGALEALQSQGNIGKTHQNEKINPIYKSLEEASVRSKFHGYQSTKVQDAKIIAIVKNDEKADELREGEEGLIVLDQTPFYAEAGGQVGDVGMLVRTAYGSVRLNEALRDGESNQGYIKPSATADGTDRNAETLASGRFNESNPDNESNQENIKPSATADGTDRNASIKVFDTYAPIAGIILHKSKVESGKIRVGDVVTATVDVEKRDAIRRNHTATHLVHAALKEVLGTHVKQAGSVVAPNYLRFDFTHYQSMTETEIQEIEDLVNRYILQNEPVNTNLMSIEEAMQTGAVAMFGEKYGSDVRVLSVGGGEFSKELCGGTHVRATGDIGSFKITADEAIASGVRRIRAVTGFDSFRRFREDEILIDRSLGFLKTQRDQLPSAIEKLQEELKKTRRENEELKLKIATGEIGSVSANGDEAREINGIKVLAKTIDDLDKGGMRHLSDTLLGKIKSGVVILGRTEEGKVSFIVRVSDDLTGKIRAGNIIKEIAPIVGGRGGGKPEMAEGGGTEPDKLEEAIEASFGIVGKMTEERK